MQRDALDATVICSCSSAYRRFREWAEAGVFLEKRADTYLAMLHLACALITWRAADWGRLSE